MCLVATYPVYLASQQAEHLAFYPLSALATTSFCMFTLWGVLYLPHYIGWEFFFRGFIGFGLKKYHGWLVAITVQTTITTLLHIGKPTGELCGAAVGGILFGLIAYRTRSVLYPILIHWYLGLINTYFCGS